MKTLGIETSAFSAGISILDDDKILCEYIFNTGPRHNEVLIAAIGRLLSDCGLEKGALDAVCVSIGPGSFTSLRIGVSTAKTLCYSLGTDLAGVSSLEILASNALWSQSDVCAMIDAGGGEVFFSLYQNGGSGTKAEIAAPQAACGRIKGRTVFVGSGAVKHSRLIKENLADDAVLLSGSLNIPRASTCAILGREKILSGERNNPLTLTPFYLRRSAAEDAKS